MPAPHQCPRCAVPMSLHRLEAHRIFYDSERCEKCHGVFLGEDALTRVEQTQVDTLIEFHRLPPSEEQRRPLACPEDTTTMEKVVSSRDAKVVMDFCPACRHTWLDGGEVDAIKTDSLVDNARMVFRSLRR